MPADFLPSAPLTVNWALSNRCNFNCQHCYSRPEARDELDAETLRQMMRKLAEAKVLAVNFGGGEPLLREDLLELAALGASLGLAVSMNSNGYFIDGPKAKELAGAGFKKVGISVDSHRPEIHDAFRGVPGSHARALAALRHLREAGIETSLSAVICRINFGEFPALADLAAQSGCAAINFHNFKCSGSGMANRDALDLSPAEWRDFYAQALELKQRRQDLHISLEDPVIALLGAETEASLVKGSVCGKLSLSVKTNGELTPCGFMPIVIGDLRRDDLRQLWKTSPVLQRLRHKEAREKCGSCPSWSSCLGGCSARALAVTGDFNNPDPHCWRP